jgi:hypothetical protein
MMFAGTYLRVGRATLAAAVLLAVAACGSSQYNDRAACPTTQPGGPRPPRFALLNFGNPIASESDPGWYGNGALWTRLQPQTRFLRDRQTGKIGHKLGWFRARRGLVTVTGKPLHGPPARFSAQVGTPQEYGPTGFAAGGLEFGRPGCWQVRAQLAGRVLTLVLKVPPVGR